MLTVTDIHTKRAEMHIERTDSEIEISASPEFRSYAILWIASGLAEICHGDGIKKIVLKTPGFDDTIYDIPSYIETLQEHAKRLKA